MDIIKKIMANAWEIFGYLAIGFFIFLIFAKRLKDKIFGSKPKSDSKSESKSE